jgi:hypothetical protein
MSQFEPVQVGVASPIVARASRGDDDAWRANINALKEAKARVDAEAVDIVLLCSGLV